MKGGRVRVLWALGGLGFGKVGVLGFWALAGSGLRGLGLGGGGHRQDLQEIPRSFKAQGAAMLLGLRVACRWSLHPSFCQEVLSRIW